MTNQPIAAWFRACLLITAFYNCFGAISFAPPVYDRVAGAIALPEASPFCLWVLAAWILIFGIGYAWIAFNPKPERLFIAVAAACKIAIALCFFQFWLTDNLPFISLLAGFGDLVFAIVFIIWLLQTRSAQQSAARQSEG